MKDMEKPKDVLQTRELMCYLGNRILLPRVYIIFCVNNVRKTNHLIQNKQKKSIEEMEMLISIWKQYHNSLILKGNTK